MPALKTLRWITVILFLLAVLLPLVFFNFTPNAVSLIDNRYLTENPFALEGDLTTNMESYVSDRIGFRDEAISAFTVLNDRLFGKMVHPTYTYGKDGHVFGAGLTTTNDFNQYHVLFADTVKKLQDYCEARNVPFLFVFSPVKPAVYPDKIADGINYNREWVDMLIAELEKRDVHYLDNTETMVALRAAGEEPYNQKYDANHWNDLGAFYGTQQMQKLLKEKRDDVHVNDLSEFRVGETLKESLMVSNFPIHEYVPRFVPNVEYQNLRDEYYPEIRLHESYREFGYYVNETRINEGAPSLLCFQGSYMNSYGYKFMLNSFGEYVHIHDYQNVLDLPYYFNIFQPDCVIFEVAEYTVNTGYFDWRRMQDMNLNPALSSVDQTAYTVLDISAQNVTVDKGNKLATIRWNTTSAPAYVWLTLDDTYDMQPVDGGYEVTIKTEDYESAAKRIQIYISNS